MKILGAAMVGLACVAVVDSEAASSCATDAACGRRADASSRQRRALRKLENRSSSVVAADVNGVHIASMKKDSSPLSPSFELPELSDTPRSLPRSGWTLLKPGDSMRACRPGDYLDYQRMSRSYYALAGPGTYTLRGEYNGVLNPPSATERNPTGAWCSRAS